MSQTQTFVVVLVLGVGVLLFLFAALRARVPATAEIGFGRLFTLKASLSPTDKEKVAQAAGEAAQARGQPADAAADDVRGQVAQLQQVRLVRALWVDDTPDNNVYESIALSHLGVFITVATTNAAARLYMADAAFDIVITDVGRKGTTDDGRVLVKELHRDRPTVPVVVYTIDAAARREQLLADGATAVEDRPDRLVAAVLAALA